MRSVSGVRIRPALQAARRVMGRGSSSQMKRPKHDSRKMELIERVVTAVGGAGVVIAAIWYFFSRTIEAHIVEAVRRDSHAELETLKNELDLKVRTLQMQLDRTLLVHRAQFEVESQAVRDIWSLIARILVPLGTLCASDKFVGG